MAAAADPEVENRWRSHVANAFWVLDLPPTASYAEAERQGAKLLAMIAAAIPGADRYSTPVGARPRTDDLVRQSLAEIRDPDRRSVHEWWARGLEPQ
jgi:hypothetical protein